MKSLLSIYVRTYKGEEWAIWPGAKLMTEDGHIVEFISIDNGYCKYKTGSEIYSDEIRGAPWTTFTGYVK